MRTTRTLFLSIALGIALGIALLNAPPARADIPQQAIEQVADLRVQEAELKHLRNIGKITNGDVFAKTQVIEAQIKTLWLPYRAVPPAEDASARAAINKLVADKLSLLAPQWTQEASALKAARDQRNKQLYAEAEDDARGAADLQRQRGVLQKELAAGTLTRDAFTAKDKQASDAIAAFRKKYEDAGEEWPAWFDQRYRVMLEAALKNPDTVLPQATVAAVPAGPAKVPPASDPATSPMAAPPDVPPATIDRVADLRVQEAELRHLRDIGKITNGEVFAKTQEIDAQIKTLWLPYKALSAADDTRARAAIDRLVTDKFSLLQPQWMQEAAASTAAGEQRSKRLYAEAEDDAGRAAELQRQRVALQKEVAGGALTHDAFDAKDKQASDAIAAFRKKYDDTGEDWPNWFDQRYRVALEAALKNADTPLPQPTVPAASPGTTTAPPDFAADVKTAADLAVKGEENAYKFDKKQINQSLMANTDAAIDTDLARLKARYDALVPKRGEEFKKAYLQAAAPRIQALKAQYYPERYRPPAVAAQQNRPPTNASGSGSFVDAIVGWGIIIAIVGALVLVANWLAGSNARAKRKIQINNQIEINKFGDTKEKRSNTIDRIFDRKTDDLSFYLNARGISCQFFRALSAMSAREREVLRTAYHLYNLGLFGEEINFHLVRFGLIYADGKAVVTGSSTYPPRHRENEFRSLADALKWYQGSNGLEAMINLTLSWLPANSKKTNDDPVLRKLSARLHGDGGDLRPGAPLTSGTKGEPMEGGLILGLDEKRPDTWWCYDGEGSLITVAPPGSGKTQSQVFPNLLMWKGAAVVLDVKGEIYEQTSKWRRENVGPVYKFSPLDPATSHGYNPLTEVRADLDYLWEDARFLANMMIVPSGAKEPFWENRARDVLTAAIARVCLEEDIAKRSMADVLDILHSVGWDKFVTYMEARIDFPSMSREGRSLASMDPKTRDGVLQSALSSMSAWDGERIARATRKSDWSPLDLRGGTNPTIYICLKPNEVDSYISLLRVFIAQHIRSLTSMDAPAHGVPPILFMLDELPRLKYMPPIEVALETGRQYGIRLWLFAQSLGQLKNAYPNAEGMIGGCAIRMFMNPSLHDETAHKVSDDIGFQESVIDGTRVKIVEPPVLAGPDYKDVVIVMAANARAARLRKYFAYEDEALTARMGSSAREPAPVS